MQVGSEKSIVERADATGVWVIAHTESDGGLAYFVGKAGVTEIHITKRHGPMDWIPYVEVYQGEHLLAEMPQHNTICVEFEK